MKAVVTKKSADIIKLLLEHGANPNAQDKRKSDNEGLTSLHYAASFQNADVVNLLLSHGASNEIKDAKGRLAHQFVPKTNTDLKNIIQNATQKAPPTLKQTPHVEQKKEEVKTVEIYKQNVEPEAHKPIEKQQAPPTSVSSGPPPPPPPGPPPPPVTTGGPPPPPLNVKKLQQDKPSSAPSSPVRSPPGDLLSQIRGGFTLRKTPESSPKTPTTPTSGSSSPLMSSLLGAMTARRTAIEEESDSSDSDFD